MVAIEPKLDELRGLVDLGRRKQAEERYPRAWQATDNLLSGNGSLIPHLVALGIILTLIDFQIGEEAGPPIQPSAELLEITGNIDGDVERSFQNAMTSEYLLIKSALVKFGETGCVNLARICLFQVGWPFLDKPLILKDDHDRTLEIVSAFGSTSKARGEIPSSRDTNDGYEEFKVSILKNPIGSALQTAIQPDLGKFAPHGSSARNSLAVFRYAMEYRLSEVLGVPPIDLMTGEPFVVTDKGGHFRGHLVTNRKR